MLNYFLGTIIYFLTSSKELQLFKIEIECNINVFTFISGQTLICYCWINVLTSSKKKDPTLLNYICILWLASGVITTSIPLGVGYKLIMFISAIKRNKTLLSAHLNAPICPVSDQHTFPRTASSARITVVIPRRWLCDGDNDCGKWWRWI